MNLTLWDKVSRNKVNGNGSRFVIWVQGCSIGCKGCWNKMTWSKDAQHSNAIINVEDLYQEILQEYKSGHIQGVTFTGGEPYEQEQGLIELAKLIKQNTDMDIQIFSGFVYDEIKDHDLTKYCDVLVAGPYGSQQTTHNFGKEHWEFNNTNIQFEMDDQGNILISGYPTSEFMEDIFDTFNTNKSKGTKC